MRGDLVGKSSDSNDIPSTFTVIFSLVSSAMAGTEQTTPWFPELGYKAPSSTFSSFSISHARQRDRVFLDRPEVHTQSIDSSLHSMNARISCLQDDERLVELGKYQSSLTPEFEAAHCQRILFVWRVVIHLCETNHDLALQTWELLLGGEVGEDIWLWTDGDETRVGSYHLCSDSPSQRYSGVSGWRLTSSDLYVGILALQRRLKRVRRGVTESLPITERRKRICVVDPGVRFAAIAWSIATSEAMGCANASRGVKRPDFRGLYYWLRNVVELSDSAQEFIKSTSGSDFWQKHGPCYNQLYIFDFEELSWWSYIASLVIPSQESDATSFRNFCPGRRCADR